MALGNNNSTMPTWNGNGSFADWLNYNQKYQQWYAPIAAQKQADATWQQPASYGTNYFGSGADNNTLSGILSNFTSQGYQPTNINASYLGISNPQDASLFNYLQYLTNQANYQNDQTTRLAAQALGTQGTAAKGDIEQSRQRGLSGINQQMTNMGLGNTTVGNTLGNRVNTLASQESARVDEQVGQQFADLLKNRSYSAPSSDLYASLLSRR